MSQSAVQSRLAGALLTAVFLWTPVRALAQEFEEISPVAADSLGLKILFIEQAARDTSRTEGEESVNVSEVEMESFVLYWMKVENPPRVESIDVTVAEGLISAETSLTFDEENPTGSVIVDTLFAGTHTLFVQGALRGRAGRGVFELREVRVDEFTVPLVVIEVLISSFVTPRYPAVDLDEPFTIPWGIEEIRLVPGRAEIEY
jgi:hypothetical protein